MKRPRKGSLLLKHANISMLFVIDVACCGGLLPELPREFVLHQTVSVRLHEGVSAAAKVVPGNLSTDMVGQVPVDVKSQPFDKGTEGHVDSGEQGSVHLVPVLLSLPSNTTRVAVVEISEGREPELEDKEGNEVQLPERAKLGEKVQCQNSTKSSKDDTSGGSTLVLIGKNWDEEVVGMVDNGTLEEEGSEHVVVNVLGEGGHLIHILSLQGTPEVIAIHVVGVRMVVVVGHLPRVVREHQRHHANSANDLVKCAVLGKGLVRTVVRNNKETSSSSSVEEPGNR